MTDESILLVTTSYDPATELVAAALDERGARYTRFDTDRFSSSCFASFDPANGARFVLNSKITVSGQIKSVWYRHLVAPDLPASLDQGEREFCERETRAFMSGVLATLPTARWLSDPVCIATAERKPYQLYVASRLGFTTPATVVTNNPETVREFSAKRQIVAKAVSSGYIHYDDGNHAIFTSHVSPGDLTDLESLNLAPVTFQELIPKQSDIRVTVVNADVYAAEILSQSRESSRIDWRATDDPELEHLPHQLPEGIADLCRALLVRLGLHYGAIDLVLTPSGEYVFLEINPNGEWVWIEERLGYPISKRVAEWLDEDAP